MNQSEVKSLNPTLFLGIDGGGSKCRAKLISSDQSLCGTGVAGRANPVQGVDRSIQSILESSLAALHDAGLESEQLSEVVAGVGLAGVNLPSVYEQMSQWQHPFKAMYLTTDLHIACLGAHAWQDGAVIITGTGSCGISIVNGHSKIFGAHGFILGDQCSGAWLGLQAISAVLLAYDGLGSSTILSDKVSQHLQAAPSEFADRMSNKPPRDFAKLAPMVFECAEQGDEVARSIIKEGAAYVNLLAKALLKENSGRLSVLGGIGPKIIPWLEGEVRSALSEPIYPPEVGAIHFAQSEHEKSLDMIETA